MTAQLHDASDPSMRKDAANGRLVADMRAEHQEWLDGQPTSTSCFFCDWTTDGTAAECRAAARVHREREHPEAANRLGRRRSANVPRHRRTDEENEQAGREAAEARRVRAEREDADRLAQIERGRQRDGLAATNAGEPQDREEEPLGPHLDAESPEPQPADSPPPRDESGLEETPAAEDASPGVADVSSSPTTHDDERTTMSETVAERLGLKKFGRGFIWTREAMIEAVREYVRAHGEPPSMEDAKRAPLGMLPSTKSIGAEFRDWSALVEAAGFTPRAKGSGLGPSGEESGRPTPPTGAAPAQAEEPAPSPEHGPKRDRGGRRPTWTREAALEKLHAEAVDGVAPSRAAFIASGISNAVIARLFGTYTEMIAAAGLTPMLAARYQRGAEPMPEPAAEHERMAIALVPPPLRDPIRTADIPYDAEILEDEARFLRQRADALDQIAAGVRALAFASRRDVDQDEELAA